jgi:WD40 repeat protein
VKISAEPSHRVKLPTAVLGLAVSDDESIAYAACMDGVYRVEIAGGEPEKLYEHLSYASSVVVRSSAKQLVSAGYDGVLKWYDLEQRQVVREVQAHQFWSWRMAIAPDHTHVASVTGQYLAGSYEYDPAPEREPSVRVYNAETGELVHSLAHVPSVQAVAYSPDGRYLAAANLMGEIRVWDASTGELKAQWTTGDFTSWGIIKSHCYIGGIYDLHFTPDSQQLIATGMGPMRDPMAGNGKQTWQKFDWQASPPAKVGEHASGEGLMEALAFTPDGQSFVMAGRLRGGDCNAAIFSNASGEKLSSVDSKCRITSARFSSNGSQLWLAGTQGQGEHRDGKFPPFGRLDIYGLE